MRTRIGVWRARVLLAGIALALVLIFPIQSLIGIDSPLLFPMFVAGYGIVGGMMGFSLSAKRLAFGFSVSCFLPHFISREWSLRRFRTAMELEKRSHELDRKCDDHRCGICWSRAWIVCRQALWQKEDCRRQIVRNQAPRANSRSLSPNWGSRYERRCAKNHRRISWLRAGFFHHDPRVVLPRNITISISSSHAVACCGGHCVGLHVATYRLAHRPVDVCTLAFVRAGAFLAHG